MGRGVRVAIQVGPGQVRAGQGRAGHREWGGGWSRHSGRARPGQVRAAVNRVECEDPDQGRIQWWGDGGYRPSLDGLKKITKNE